MFFGGLISSTPFPSEQSVCAAATAAQNPIVAMRTTSPFRPCAFLAGVPKYAAMSCLLAVLISGTIHPKSGPCNRDEFLRALYGGWSFFSPSENVQNLAPYSRISL